MHWLRLATVIILVLFIMSPAVARAGDLCLRTNHGAFTLDFVLKKFAKPGKNSCKSISGFSPRDPAFGGPAVIVSGHACLNTKGTRLWIGLTQYPFGQEAMRMFQMNLDVPTVSGNFSEVGIRTSDGTTLSGSGLVFEVPCSPEKPPIP